MRWSGIDDQPGNHPWGVIRFDYGDVARGDASLDLGVGPVVTFWHVMLSNLKSALLGSALLVFTLSFDEVPVAFFLTGSENTLPMHIWSMLREGVTPEINALTITLSILVVSLGLRLLSRD